MVIEISHLTKQFKGKGGFVDISLCVAEGEVFSFLGKNGAGKSTFVRTLLGLLHADSGEARLLGQPIGHVDTRKQVGYLPELFQYHAWLTGYELLYNHGLLYKMAPKEIKARIPTVLKIIGLEGHDQKTIRQYSKGMKQRIGLGCAIISDPKILFLDEPTSALDPIGRKQVRDIIIDLKNEGKTIFLNTHLLSEVELISDRVAMMDRGRILKTGTMKELLQAPLLLTVGNVREELVNRLTAFDGQLKRTPQGFELNIENEEVLPKIAAAIISSGGLLYEMKRKDNALEKLFIDTVGEEDAR
ncbi:ABC transporter ATP-binding protein [Petroclostridium sp. X23]|jgi:ABC-2 type transport system ATP-binding protein|uniref:ABC transporter ATP-binding protein n=1 Tax=Petroclostridium sp. X23 TaxID=3045146 RepID=UPI0024AD18E6|nr:ABC transporter ATP-binding protein [Petroclostridium sp. X23]WHH57911.1 ABC transporter ATP-binding protein [Petroclostridium sp. X23]